LLEKALQGYRELRALEASASMKVVDRPNRFTLRCKAQLYVQHPQKLRLSATKGIGMEILDLSMEGKRLDVYLPRKRRLYQGSTSDLQGSGISFHPASIVSMLLLNPATWMKQSWTATRLEKGIELREAVRTGPREVLLFSADQSLLLRRSIVDREKRELLVVEFSKHRPLGPRALPYPHRVLIRFPLEDQSILMVLRKPQANPPLTAEDFQLALPAKGVEVRELSSIHKSQETEALSDQAPAQEPTR
jgi:hypothetical protein